METVLPLLLFFIVQFLSENVRTTKYNMNVSKTVEAVSL
jgi:hypothetical protein